MTSSGSELSNPAESSIATIVRLEQEDELKVSAVDRFAAALGRGIGTVTFLLVQLAAVALWVAINVGAIPIIGVFDPYPFFLLAGLLCLECVLLTSLVLIRQNRMMARADRRNHLGLQITLLAEKESTKVIQMLDRLSREIGIEGGVSDQEARELSKETPLEHIAEELRQQVD